MEAHTVLGLILYSLQRILAQRTPVFLEFYMEVLILDAILEYMVSAFLSCFL